MFNIYPFNCFNFYLAFVHSDVILELMGYKTAIHQINPNVSQNINMLETKILTPEQWPYY